jgi:hypothetical protein
LLQTPRSGDFGRYVAWVGVIVAWDGWMRRMVIVLEDMLEVEESPSGGRARLGWRKEGTG